MHCVSGVHYYSPCTAFSKNNIRISGEIVWRKVDSKVSDSSLGKGLYIVIFFSIRCLG